MKKTNLQCWYYSCLPVFLLLTCLIVTSVGVQAQSLQTQAQQNGSWVPSGTAVDLLGDNIETVTDQLPGLEEGTQPYDNALRRVSYYKGIIRELKANKTVPLALEAALADAATLGGEKETSFTSKLILRALYDETKVLLSK